MSGPITLTAAMRANLLSLQQTGASLSTTQLALATGNKVNSALDNPVNFFAAQALNHRASQLSALLDGMGQAVQTIQAANQGITSITSLVNQLTSITNSATQDLAKTVASENILQTAGASGLASTIVAGLDSGASNGQTITAGDTITLTDGTNPAATFKITAGETLNQLVAAINQTTGFNASIVMGDGTTQSASAVTNGAPSGGAMAVGSAYLTITSTDGHAITATDSQGGNDLTALGLGAASTVVSSGVPNDAADQTNYQAVLTQITALASDANYQGNKLINGVNNNLTVQVNELSTNSITVKSVDSTATGLGLTQTDISNANNIATAVSQINAALATLQTQAAGFANSLSMIQNRQDFTTNLVNTLQNGASALTIADKNEEGANLLALQTQQQLGIEALSLSSQANQSVLRLFA